MELSQSGVETQPPATFSDSFTFAPPWTSTPVTNSPAIIPPATQAQDTFMGILTKINEKLGRIEERLGKVEDRIGTVEETLQQTMQHNAFKHESDMSAGEF